MSRMYLREENQRVRFRWLAALSACSYVAFSSLGFQPLASHREVLKKRPSTSVILLARRTWARPALAESARDGAAAFEAYEDPKRAHQRTGHAGSIPSTCGRGLLAAFVRPPGSPEACGGGLGPHCRVRPSFLFSGKSPGARLLQSLSASNGSGRTPAPSSDGSRQWLRRLMYGLVVLLCRAFFLASCRLADPHRIASAHFCSAAAPYCSLDGLLCVVPVDLSGPARTGERGCVPRLELPI